MLRTAYRPDSTEPDRALLRRYAAGDPAAFAQLLDRHGPLVYGACRRALGGHDHSAEDAFQATFLVLARKAARLRDPDSLPGWLFGVARRVASAARRRDVRQERVSKAGAKPEAVTGGEWDDLLAVVDEEIAALPDDLRAAVLSCLYHGKTQDEAAAELGWSLSTLRRRLDRGRELLRSRLTTRGIAPAVALVAGAVAPSAVTALPADVRAATLDLAAGGTTPAAVSTLARVGSPRSTTLGAGWLIAGVTAVGVTIGTVAWVALDRPSELPPVAAAPNLEPPKHELLPELPAVPLPPRAVARLGTTRFRHGTDGAFGMVDPLGVVRFGFLPDGTLASVGGGRVRFWDAATGAERHADGPGVAAGSRWMLRALPFDGGRRLLVPMQDAGMNLLPATREWNLTDRTPVRRIAFARHPDRKGDVIGPTAVTADGTRFAQTDGNGDGWVWHADGTAGAKLAGKVREHGPAAFLPGGAELVTATPDGRFRVWDVATGTERRAFGEPTPHTTAALSADGTRLAVVGEDDDPTADPEQRQLVVWDTTRGAEVRRFPLGGAAGFAAHGGAVAFTPDGRHVVAVNHVNNRFLDVRWWALDGGASGHWSAYSEGCPPRPLAVENDLRSLAVACGDGTSRGVVRVIDGVTGRERVPPGGLSAPVRAVAFAAGGAEVVTTDRAGHATTWEVATGKRLRVGMGTPPDAGVADVGFDVAAVLGPRVVVKSAVASP
ncbi:MAG TPA: sigma-70 family RNA polymerase sigma factor, partial [Urbifossiella sp.]|nr:sigma-70 family RNA polymerase sigma factor [Urbifossiella sp.]